MALDRGPCELHINSLNQDCWLYQLAGPDATSFFIVAAENGKKVLDQVSYISSRYRHKSIHDSAVRLKLLSMYKEAIPFIMPRNDSDVCAPTLWHPGFQLGHLFVSESGIRLSLPQSASSRSLSPSTYTGTYDASYCRTHICRWYTRPATSTLTFAGVMGYYNYPWYTMSHQLLCWGVGRAWEESGEFQMLRNGRQGDFHDTSMRRRWANRSRGLWSWMCWCNLQCTTVISTTILPREVTMKSGKLHVLYTCPISTEKYPRH